MGPVVLSDWLFDSCQILSLMRGKEEKLGKNEARDFPFYKHNLKKCKPAELAESLPASKAN